MTRRESTSNRDLALLLLVYSGVIGLIGLASHYVPSKGTIKIKDEVAITETNHSSSYPNLFPLNPLDPAHIYSPLAPISPTHEISPLKDLHLYGD